METVSFVHSTNNFLLKEMLLLVDERYSPSGVQGFAIIPRGKQMYHRVDIIITDT